MYEDISNLHEPLVKSIVKKLSSNITDVSTSFRDGSSGTEVSNASKHEPKVVVSMLYCLCDWLLSESTTHSLIPSTAGSPEARPAMLLADADVNAKVFSAVEASLMGRVKHRGEGGGRNANNWPVKR